MLQQRFKPTLAILFLFALILASTTAVQTQEPLTRAKLITSAREVITAARYCALITLDAKGRPQTRTLDPFPPDENMLIRLGTNSRSRKVNEIRRNPRVTLYYFDREGQGYSPSTGPPVWLTTRNKKPAGGRTSGKSFIPTVTKTIC